MSGDLAQRARALLGEAEALEHGAEQLAKGEEAVRLADRSGFEGLRYDARRHLIGYATFAGRADLALEAFTWCISLCDSSGAYSDRALLWQYKWVLGSLTGFPGISLERIEEVFEDMAARYRKYGQNLRPYWGIRLDFAMHVGDREGAREAFERWTSIDPDHYSDCAACEVNSEVDYLIFEREPERALARAEPILEGGLSCAAIPHRTLARTLVPLLRLGRVEQAAEQHRRGYRMVKGNPDHLAEVADHVDFLFVTRELRRGLELFGRHVGWALATRELDDRFDLYLASRNLFVELEARGEGGDLELRLPPEFPQLREGGRYEASELAAWLSTELEGLIASFDGRNGTDRFAQREREGRELAGIRLPPV